MSLPRIYLPGHHGPGPLSLSPEQAKRLSQVLRLRPGESFLVFGDDGREWQAEIAAGGGRHTTATVSRLVRQAGLEPLTVETWCGLIRSTRFDWAVEKCVEAGVDVLRPLVSAYAARGDSASAARLDRWSRLAVEAAEQCGRLRVPTVLPPATFDDLLRQSGREPLLLCDAGGDPWPVASRLLPEAGRVRVAVGPEGGFSPEEVAAARAAGAVCVRLGPNILRTETAAVVAVALLRGGR